MAEVLLRARALLLEEDVASACHHLLAHPEWRALLKTDEDTFVARQLFIDTLCVLLVNDADLLVSDPVVFEAVLDVLRHARDVSRISCGLAPALIHVSYECRLPQFMEALTIRNHADARWHVHDPRFSQLAFDLVQTTDVRKVERIMDL